MLRTLHLTFAAALLLPIIAPATSASPSSTSTVVQDALTLKALARIVQYEQLEPSLAAGDAKNAKLYLNQIAWAKKRLGAVSDQNEATWIDANKRYIALKAKIEKKLNGGAPPPAPVAYDYNKLVQLNKDINNGYTNFQMLSPKHLLDQSRVKGIRKELAGFTSLLATFKGSDDNIKLVTQNLANFQNLFDANMAKLEEGKQAKGGMDATLKELRAKYESNNTPGNLSYPFDAAQIEAWAVEMRRWREKEIPTDVGFLRTASTNPAINQQPVNSLFHWLTGTWERKLDESEKAVRERISSDVRQGQEKAKYILETDPANRNHVLNRILSKGGFDKHMLHLREASHAIDMARIYDVAMASPAVFGPTIKSPQMAVTAEGQTAAKARSAEQPDRGAQTKQIDKAITHLNKIVVQALDEVRMPEAASTDEKLLKIAVETLSNPDYEIAGWKRLVINTGKTSKVRREAWLRPGSVSIELSYYEYKWDQYQVTTAEEHDGKLWLYANTLKHYTSGDPTTPVGRWILSRRLELTPILAENLNK